MGPLWLAVLIVLSGYLPQSSGTCYDTEEQKEVVKGACWVANWKAGTCEQTQDYGLCKKLAQASYDDEYVCCNAIARTGRWNGESGPLGICSNLKFGECAPTGDNGMWKCTDKRPNGSKCWFPEYKKQTCMERDDAAFCSKGGHTVYKTPQYCCDMLNWGGMWNGKDAAKGICKDYCVATSGGESFTCRTGVQSEVITGRKQSPGECGCHRAQTNETWNTIAADYGTTPYTIFESNSRADPRKAPKVDSWYKICPAPGVEKARFRRGGNDVRFSGCLDSTYIRPCSGYTGKAQQDCFCSYKGDGQHQWPFDAKNCSLLVKCKDGKASSFESCQIGEVVHEEPQDDGSSTGKCVKEPKNFKCTAGCSDHSCVCRDLLLPTGIYQNPFDWDERSAIKCDYTIGGAQWFNGVSICSLGKYDSKHQDCRSELSKHCEKRESYAGCQAFYPPPDTGCPEKRKLMAASLSWGTANDLTCNWWIGRPCVCPARNRAWSTNFGCAWSTCATKLRNACINGGGYSKQPATRTRDICFCEFNGGCPFMFYRNCAFRW